MSMGIEINPHKHHRERMRARYENEGLDSFSDHEILEFLLYYVIKYMNTNQQGHSLIEEFKGFNSVLDASIDELSGVSGIGESSALFLKVIRAVIGRYVNEKIHYQRVFKDMESIGEFCVEEYRNITSETVSVLLIDGYDKLIGFIKLEDCDWRDTAMMAYRLSELVFRYNAISFVVARNSPDGNVTPDDEEGDSILILEQYFKKFNRTMTEYLIMSPGQYMHGLKYQKDKLKRSWLY